MDNIIRVIKTITWLLLSRLQGNKPHRNSPEPDPCLRNLHQPCLRNLHQRAGTLRNPREPSKTFRNQPFGTFRNLPEPTTSGTYASIHRNLPKSSGTFRELASETHTILHRNSPEPSATCLRNLHQHTPEPSGTFRKPPLEPTPAHARTLRNLPEPSSGTCSCDPHRHTPELIWAEDPISLRCWGKTWKRCGFLTSRVQLVMMRRNPCRAMSQVPARAGLVTFRLAIVRTLHQATC